jgi:hypothetical protein
LEKIMPHPEYQRSNAERMQREEFIKTRAYFLWKQAGGPEGLTLEFWLQAEKEYEELTTKREAETARQNIVEKRKRRSEQNGQQRPAQQVQAMPVSEADPE